ncbi:MAG: hypothetical protein H0W78_06425 [Planctomycetes bacterium]|nr:hypothetical protein [Planctomycetota bacterium]
MQSDAKVPDPAPRGITVPAGAVIVLVLTGAIWGVGLFLLGRQTAPPVEMRDRDGASHLASLNRIDQALVRGDDAEILAMMATATLPNDPLGQTALELRRARLTEVVMQRKAREAEAAAKAEAASPAAVLRRLRASLSTSTHLTPPALPAVPAVVPTAIEPSSAPVPSPPHVPAPVLAEEQLGDHPFIPVARLAHPTITGRAYALHPSRGLLRSDDGGKQWRVGLEPLTSVTGVRLAFTEGDQPVLLIIGTPGWIFSDSEVAFFP